ncbi:MAG: hypothetical protein LBG95_04095, partial [Treponema sp.]|nr:hypothetical protein [Treponema sp.]
MISVVTWLVMLSVFSGLSMNLILQFGLGVREITSGFNVGRERLLTGVLNLFLTVMLLWLLFTFVRPFFSLGHLEYVALFPVSSLVFASLEYLADRFIIKNAAKRKFLMDDTLSGGVLAGASLFLTLD